MVERGALDFGINANVPPCALVEPLDHLDLLSKRRHLELGRSHRESSGKRRRPGCRVHTLADPQRLDLGKCEIAYVEPAVGALPIGEYLLDVGGRIEVDIVDHHEDPVLGQRDVLLDVVGAKGVCHSDRGQGMLRQISGGCPVRNDDLGCRRG